MSELCLSTTPHLHTLLLNDFLFIFSFILSQPLYLSYFIFFSPYLVNLVSFLSPLFITTSLLLSTFLTITDRSLTDDDNPHNFEEYEVYKIVFDHTCTIDVREIIPTEEEEEGNCVTKFCTHIEEQAAEEEVPKLESFIELLGKFENMVKCNDVEEGKKVDEAEAETACPKSNKVVEGELQKEDFVSGSNANIVVIKKILSSDDYCTSAVDNGKIGGGNGNYYVKAGRDYSYSSRSFASSTSSSSSDLGSYGSMRKEKEWKRTLACKLYEERQNVGGEEGMDSLWEKYEADLYDSNNNKKKKNSKKMSTGLIEYYHDAVDEKQEEDDDDDDDLEELANGHICCLQAFKLSSGKMNFGMGKPNLVKISKAIKGIGWLHHLSRRSHSLRSKKR